MNRLIAAIAASLLIITLLVFGFTACHFVTPSNDLDKESDKLTSQEPDLPDLRTLPEINGLEPSIADRFWDRWHSITVRYRTDVGEQRYIFANDIAWQALIKHQKVFPDGAMLAKIAFSTKEDKLFPVSREPEHWTRIQLMKKNSKGFEKSAGWQFSFYMPEKVSKPELQEHELGACFACHVAAASRDYVFSKPAFIPNEWIDDPKASFADQFTEITRKELPWSVTQILDLAGKDFYFEKTKILKLTLFEGSLSESGPTLAKSAGRYHISYLLYDPNGAYLLAVVPQIRQTSECPGAVRIFTYQLNRFIKNKAIIRKGTFCDDKETKWDQAAEGSRTFKGN